VYDEGILKGMTVSRGHKGLHPNMVAHTHGRQHTLVLSVRIPIYFRLSLEAYIRDSGRFT
jgi:hypothetical protein